MNEGGIILHGGFRHDYGRKPLYSRPILRAEMRVLRLLFEPSSGDLINRYVAALIRELELVAHDLQPRTIFFGGGTPSLLISASGNKSSPRWNG